MSDRFTQSLQESVITMLCMDTEHAKIAAGILDTELFEPPYDDVASRAIDYLNKFGQVPGKAHIDDLFDHILCDPDNKRHRVYTNVLGSILDQAEGLNAPFVLSRVHEFMRAQNLKAAVIEAGQRYQQGGANIIDDVEGILHKALKFKSEPLSAGTYLGDVKKIIGFINKTSSATYKLGIPEFDHKGIGPTLGEILGFMAPKGRGKTWFCIDTGIKCLQQGAHVIHISLEMSEDRILPRYLQRLFAIAKRPDRMKVPHFSRDDNDRVDGFSMKNEKPAMSFQDSRLDYKVKQKLGDFGERFNRLIVKNFPTDSLSVAALESYLDSLELTNKFTPTVLILDYPDLMDVPGGPQFLRHSLGKLYKELRGICQRRNIAGIFPIQSNREGESARLVTAELTGEDYSKTHTCDMLITYSQTKREKSLGLARLYVDKARGDQDGFTVLIAQNYATGQFVIDSTYFPDKYWENVKKALGEGEEE